VSERLAGADPGVEGAASLLDLRREHEADLRLVHVALAELGEPEAGAVADQLVGQRAADTLEQQAPDGVLQHTAVLGP
jgi:hypothetical protein